MKGVHLDMPDNVMAAIQSNEIGLLRLRLEEHPNDVHLRTQSHGWTPLLFAIRQCNCAMAKLLLDKGADPNLADAKGRAPIHLAAAQGDTVILAAAGSGSGYRRGMQWPHRARGRRTRQPPRARAFPRGRKTLKKSLEFLRSRFIRRRR